MSREVLWQVVGRARVDLSFAEQIRADADHALADAGYALEPSEVEDVKRFLVFTPDPPPAPPGAFPGPMQDPEIQRAMKDRFISQMGRMDGFNDYAIKLIKGTFDNAKGTYKTITWMNLIMFGMGIGLFLAAAVYAVVADQKIYSLVFGGLGSATFVALFLLGPIEKTQRALSNLVQAEIAFMNFFDQITFWENYAQIPRPTPPYGPEPANVERASEMLQQRSRETMELLQLYVEDEISTGRREEPPTAAPAAPHPPKR